MTFEYRRVSLNTTLKNARIFDEDSWESDQDILNKIKKEPVDSEDTNQSWFEDRIATAPLKEDPWDSDDNVVSPIKQERIDFENKLRFDSNDSKDSIGADNEISQDNTGKNRVRKNLKRKNDMFIKQESGVEDTPSTPKKRLTSTSSKNSSPERKKFKDGNKKKKKEFERDPVVLKRRQKQIDYGKNTIGYDKYLELVPRHKRTPTDPQTPDKYGKYSRRGFDGLIKQWRIKLHKYDPDDNINSLNEHL